MRNLEKYIKTHGKYYTKQWKKITSKLGIYYAMTEIANPNQLRREDNDRI